MKILLILLLIITFSPLKSFDIIIRHDVEDDRYIEFAKKLPVRSSIIQYNHTDLAGTLIGEQWILSAAHVAETIAMDHRLLTTEGDSLDIDQIIIHPEWDETGRPDLALIKLKNPVKGLPVIPLYKKQDELNQVVIIAGIGDFGTGKTGVEGNPGTWRAATNKVDGYSSDNYFLYWLFDAPDSDNVTELEGAAGPGDSAGPAFIIENDTYYLAGVSAAQSTAATGGVKGLYGVTEYYTRVSTFIDWIEKSIEKNS